MEVETEQQIRHECPKCGLIWFTVEVFVVEIEPPERNESRD